LEENKKKKIKILPKNFILGNLSNVHSNLDRRITIFKGQIVRTYLMNVEKNLFINIKANIKYPNLVESKPEQDHLFDKNRIDKELRSKSNNSKKRQSFKSKCQVTTFMNTSFRENIIDTKSNAGKSCSKILLPSLKSKFLDKTCLFDIDKSELKPELTTNATKSKIGCFNINAMKMKSKSVKKLKTKSFFDNSDFYYV
jgi:hypothetical protein